MRVCALHEESEAHFFAGVRRTVCLPSATSGWLMDGCRRRTTVAFEADLRSCSVRHEGGWQALDAALTKPTLRVDATAPLHG